MLEWDDCVIGCETRGLVLASGDTFENDRTGGVRCRTGRTAGRLLPSANGEVEIAERPWGVLDGFVQRTYVAASDLSRRRGAGAEVDDSD